jgi:hypothetical protein
VGVLGTGDVGREREWAEGEFFFFFYFPFLGEREGENVCV